MGGPNDLASLLAANKPGEALAAPEQGQSPQTAGTTNLVPPQFATIKIPVTNTVELEDLEALMRAGEFSGELVEITPGAPSSVKLMQAGEIRIPSDDAQDTYNQNPVDPASLARIKQIGTYYLVEVVHPSQAQETNRDYNQIFVPVSLATQVRLSYGASSVAISDLPHTGAPEDLALSQALRSGALPTGEGQIVRDSASMADKLRVGSPADFENYLANYFAANPAQTRTIGPYLDLSTMSDHVAISDIARDAATIERLKAEFATSPDFSQRLEDPKTVFVGLSPTDLVFLTKSYTLPKDCEITITGPDRTARSSKIAAGTVLSSAQAEALKSIHGRTIAGSKYQLRGFNPQVRHSMLVFKQNPAALNEQPQFKAALSFPPDSNIIMAATLGQGLALDTSQDALALSPTSLLPLEASKEPPRQLPDCIQKLIEGPGTVATRSGQIKDIDGNNGNNDKNKNGATNWLKQIKAKLPWG